MNDSGIAAILWDYDGTLADSSRKNIEVTLEILRSFIPDLDDNIPEVLASRSSYQDACGKFSDWKELYRTLYGLSDEQVYEAGKMWSSAQLKNETLSDIFPGMEDVLESFEHVKMGVCSQNGSEIIRRSLEHHGVLKYIDSIVGYDEVAYDFQKPDPEAFLICLERLGISERNRRFVYIGDHSVDVAFSRNAEAVLKKDFPDVQVICIAIHHKGLYPEDSPEFPPDYTVRSAGELLSLLKELDIKKALETV